LHIKLGNILFFSFSICTLLASTNWNESKSKIRNKLGDKEIDEV
jgi:hypothetical protein